MRSQCSILPNPVDLERAWRFPTTSSRAKRTAAIGVLKAAASAADAPTGIRASIFWRFRPTFGPAHDRRDPGSDHNRWAFAAERQGPLPPKSLTGRGRTPTRMQRNRNTNRFRSSNWPSRCLPSVGRTSPGAKAPPRPCVPVSPQFAFVPLIWITSATRRIRKSGCWSSGPRPHPNRSGTGSPLLGPIPRFPIWLARDPTESQNFPRTVRSVIRPPCTASATFVCGIPLPRASGK